MCIRDSQIRLTILKGKIWTYLDYFWSFRFFCPSILTRASYGTFKKSSGKARPKKNPAFLKRGWAQIAYYDNYERIENIAAVSRLIVFISKGCYVPWAPPYCFRTWNWIWVWNCFVWAICSTSVKEFISQFVNITLNSKFCNAYIFLNCCMP